MTSRRASSLNEVQLAEQAQLREDEILALEAILPPGAFTRGSPPKSASSSHIDTICLTIPGLLPTLATVSVHTIQADDARLEAQPGNHANVDTLNSPVIEASILQGLTYLPPLKVLVHLPKEYPMFAAPIIAHIQSDYLDNAAAKRGNTAVSSLAACWRSEVVSWLKGRLTEQWEQSQSEVLYIWYEYLREGMWQDMMEPQSGSNCPLMVGSTREIILKEFITGLEIGRTASPPLATSLRSYDLLSRRKEFEGERFGCGICLEDKRGGKCWRIADCGHVFCQECLSSYLSSMIKEGYIRQASSCPDPECVKARVSAENLSATDKTTVEDESSIRQIGSISDEELTQFVGENLVARLADLKEKALASTDPTAGYCPRPGCERLVRADPKDVGTSYEAMRICQCGFTYCLYCNKAWHGKSPCNLVSSTALIERYQRAGENSSVRREMELKYGKANLERMVRTYEEEMQNKQYIDSHTQSCPCCRVRIEKSMGCNHMTCRACNTHLCYRCGSRLNPREPYRHFNTPGTACFEKLFDHIGSVEAPGEWAFIGAEEEEMAMWEAEEL